jgi:hypothetical protein
MIGARPAAKFTHRHVRIAAAWIARHRAFACRTAAATTTKWPECLMVEMMTV